MENFGENQKIAIFIQEHIFFPKIFICDQRSGKYCLSGITRANVLMLCGENRIESFEKDFSLIDVYGADEAFVTGTFAGLIPVTEIDGRLISDTKGPVTTRLQKLYKALCDREAII